MKEKLLIIGASGHGKVVADIALKMKKWKNIAFLDDNKQIVSSLGLEVLGELRDVQKFVCDWDIFVAIGNNTTRKLIQKKIEKMGANIPTLIHPRAIIGEQVSLASGTVVMGGVIINNSTKIGKGCILNTGSTIDHDNLIGDYVHISPGTNLAGSVKIGEVSWLGIGSSVINNINIVSECIIGAGSVVVNDLNKKGTYVGIPARRVEQ